MSDTNYDIEQAKRLNVPIHSIRNRRNKTSRGLIKDYHAHDDNDKYTVMLALRVYGTTDTIKLNRCYTERAKSVCSCCGQGTLGKRVLTDSGRRYLRLKKMGLR